MKKKKKLRVEFRGHLAQLYFTKEDTEPGKARDMYKFLQHMSSAIGIWIWFPFPDLIIAYD